MKSSNEKNKKIIFFMKNVIFSKNIDHLSLASFSFIRFPGSSPFACELLFYYIYVVSSRIYKRIVKIFQSQNRLEAGGKPSTWLPPG